MDHDTGTKGEPQPMEGPQIFCVEAEADRAPFTFDLRDDNVWALERALSFKRGMEAL